MKIKKIRVQFQKNKNKLLEFKKIEKIVISFFKIETKNKMVQRSNDLVIIKIKVLLVI